MQTSLSNSLPRRPQYLLDINAVFWAGLISGLIYVIFSAVLSAIYHGNAWLAMRVSASLLMGPEVLFPQNGLEPVTLLVGIMLQLFLALIYTLLIAFIFHRGGLIMGLLGGALMGLALYMINFNNFGFFFPWIFPLRGTVLLVTHVVFGAVSGFLYELFEEDDYDLPVEVKPV